MDPLALDGVDFEARRVAVDDGVSLRVLRWAPRRPEKDWPVVFVSGWVSQVEGWAHLLRVLAARQTVFYVETRDKESAEIPAGLPAAHFAIDRNARDLAQVCDSVGEADRRVIVAASLGATILVEALKARSIAARAALLVGPTLAFPNPWWLGPLTYLPAAAWPPVRAFVLWYLRRFKVDAAREPEQMARYVRTLHAAEPVRLKLAARMFRGFAVWEGLERIAVPLGVAWAESDTLHGASNVRRLLDRVPGAVALPCPSNLYMHRAELCAELDRLVECPPG